MKKYRIVNDRYCGFEVQKKFLWLFWIEAEGKMSRDCNTFNSLDEAKEWIKVLKKREKTKTLYSE